MKLAFIGQGGMGRVAMEEARERGHEIGAVIASREAGLSADALAAKLRGHEAAIDFSRADAVLRNVQACVQAAVPLVEGTTGWQAQESEVRRVVEQGGGRGGMIYGANFSIGVNLFYRLVTQAGTLFAATGDYTAFIEEEHHARKKDAPSGTALRLRDLLHRAMKEARDIPIASTREGDVAGTHRVGFDSSADRILLTHEARSREGFAQGALLAARWIAGRRGVYLFADVLDELLTQERKR
jgi:4-hydroxy-tetrahydrodipicolinate reductase